MPADWRKEETEGPKKGGACDFQFPVLDRKRRNFAAAMENVAEIETNFEQPVFLLFAQR